MYTYWNHLHVWHHFKMHFFCHDLRWRSLATGDRYNLLSWRCRWAEFSWSSFTWMGKHGMIWCLTKWWTPTSFGNGWFGAGSQQKFGITSCLDSPRWGKLHLWWKIDKGSRWAPAKNESPAIWGFGPHAAIAAYPEGIQKQHGKVKTTSCSIRLCFLMMFHPITCKMAWLPQWWKPLPNRRGNAWSS